MNEREALQKQYSGIGMLLNTADNNSRSVYQSYEPALSQKDYDNPYFCKVCHVTCNSDDSYEMHLKGTKHAKKLRQLGKDPGYDPDEIVPVNTISAPKGPKYLSLGKLLVYK